MTEDQLEQETLGWLHRRWATRTATAPTSPMTAPTRSGRTTAQVLLPFRLREAIAAAEPRMCRRLRAKTRCSRCRTWRIPALLSANRAFHKLLVGGVPVQYQQDGETRGDFVRLVDWAQPGAATSSGR